MTEILKYFYFSDTGQFIGTYNPPISFIESIFNQNLITPTSQADQQGGTSRRRRSLLAVSPSNPNVVGISNPTTCLRYNDAMLFSVSNDFYPVYDERNLYNTNPNFDYGAFKDLSEQHRLIKTNSTLFAFRFTEPGVYVFKMSSSSEQRLVRLLFVCLFVCWSSN